MVAWSPRRLPEDSVEAVSRYARSKPIVLGRGDDFVEPVGCCGGVRSQAPTELPNQVGVGGIKLRHDCFACLAIVPTLHEAIELVAGEVELRACFGGPFAFDQHPSGELASDGCPTSTANVGCWRSFGRAGRGHSLH